jgi:uncharacterized membrane protein
MTPAPVEPDRLERLEIRLGRILHVGAAGSTALLAVGVALWLLGWRGDASAVFLHAGLIVLMATPVARVVVSCVEYVRERDWLFAATTLAVLAVLLTTVLVAIRTALAR